MSSQEFMAVRRHEVAGRFADGRLELVQGGAPDSSWFGCGGYRIDGRTVVVVDEPADPFRSSAVGPVTRPDWADVVVYANVLTEVADPSVVIEVSGPVGSEQAAAFCAVCAAYDDAFTDLHPVQALVRVDGRLLRVLATRAPGPRWAGRVADASADELRKAARWQLFGSVALRFGWGGWDGSEFRWSERSPYDVAGLLPYLLVSLGDHHLAVVIDPVTPEQHAGLDAAALPAGTEALIIGRLTTTPDAPTARISAELVRPGIDSATTAAALAAGCYLGGRLDLEPEQTVVRVAGEQLSVIMESDVDEGVPLWSFRTRPA